jgi:ABC-type ATPase with predicted acetyltransferase domain
MLVETDFTTRVRYPTAPASFPLLDEMWIERGSKADWDLLHDLHYKAENLAAGPRFWRLTLRGRTIGVLVFAISKGLLKERHVAFKHLKPDGRDTRLTNKHRYVWLNDNMPVVSRLVVDTMFRGVGIGYRFQNLACRLQAYPLAEIQSSMSKFNPFSEKAGFRFVAPMNSTKYEAGLKFFRARLEANPQDQEAVLEELDRMSQRLRDKTVQDMRDFYYKNSALEKTGNNRGRGQTRVDEMSERALVKSLQQLLFASPLYGVYRNPDYGRTLPERLPLTAFDRQAPTESLVLP